MSSIGRRGVRRDDFMTGRIINKAIAGGFAIF
jgi:hypothetical protein